MRKSIFTIELFGQCTKADVGFARSDPESGVLDAVLAIASFDDAVDVGVELADLFDLGLDAFAGGSVVPEVLGFAEEVVAETFVRVDEDAVLVAVGSSGSILAQERHVPNEVGVFVTLGGGSLLGGLVVASNHVLNSAFNLNNVQAGAESAA